MQNPKPRLNFSIEAILADNTLKSEVEDRRNIKPCKNEYARSFSEDSLSNHSDERSTEDEEELNVEDDSDQRRDSIEEEEDHSRVKPPFTYNSLIMMAIQDSPQKRLPLSGIYDYLIRRFPQFQNNRPVWQNAIRHSLSTCKYFAKVPRSFNDPGRGHYWVLTPSALEVVIGENTGRLRRKYPGGCTSQLAAMRHGYLPAAPHYQHLPPVSPYANPYLPPMSAENCYPIFPTTVFHQVPEMPRSFGYNSQQGM